MWNSHWPVWVYRGIKLVRSQKYLQPIMCSKGRLIRMHKGLVHCPFNLGFFWEFISTYAIWQPLKQQRNINQ